MQRIVILAALLVVVLASCKSQKHLNSSTPVVVTQPASTPAPAATAAPKATEELLEDYMIDVAFGGTTMAGERSKEEVLKLFESAQTPVLLLIYEEGDFKDYDEPTTIGAYLEYLQLQGKRPGRIRQALKNANGKIIELELAAK